MQTLESRDPEEPTPLAGYTFLRPGVVAAIEHALATVGAFGEVHLIVERGRLRFIRTIKSEAIERAKS